MGESMDGKTGKKDLVELKDLLQKILVPKAKGNNADEKASIIQKKEEALLAKEEALQAKEKARDTIEMFLYQHGVNKYLNEGSEKA